MPCETGAPSLGRDGAVESALVRSAGLFAGAVIGGTSPAPGVKSGAVPRLSSLRAMVCGDPGGRRIATCDVRFLLLALAALGIRLGRAGFRPDPGCHVSPAPGATLADPAAAASRLTARLAEGEGR